MQQLELFKANLPHKPYCTNELSSGVVIRSQDHALRHSHIQYNPPPTVAWLVFDIDRIDAANAWLAAELPPPAWIAKNPKNGHCHVAYGISTPVCRTSLARRAPLDLLMAIEQAYREALAADRGFACLITKNPLHEAWDVIHPAADAGIYELNYLAEFVQLNKIDRRKKIEPYGLGRNCILFDRLRIWAYTAVRDYWRPGGENDWAAAVQLQAESLNLFTEPLPYSEIRASAKSVSRWVWKNFTPAALRELIDATHAPELQSRRGQRSGVVRAAKSQALAMQAGELKKQGYKQKQIAEKLNLSPGRISQMLKKFN